MSFIPNIYITSYAWLFLVVQLLRRVWLFAAPWIAACQISPSFTISWSLFRLMSIMSMMPSNHLIPCHPYLLLPSIFPSFTVFSNESVLLIMWPKYWSFSFSINPSNEYPGLVSIRIDWFDLLAVQETFKSLLQHHSTKASILQHSAFFMVQLSHPFAKIIALTTWTFAGKALSLLFNTLWHHSKCWGRGPFSLIHVQGGRGSSHYRVFLPGISWPPDNRRCPPPPPGSPDSAPA